VFDTTTANLRLRVIGLKPVQTDQLIQCVQKWISCNGEEWTVKRLKAMKVDLLRFYADLPPTMSHTWTRHKKDGSPKGPFGCLFRLSKSNFRTAWNAIMVYTGIIHLDPKSKVTKSQWKGMVEAIRRPNLEPEVLIKGLQVVHQSPFFVACNVTSMTGDPLLDYQPSPSRRAPKGERTVPEIEGVVDSLRPLIGQPLWTTRNWDILSGTVRGLENSIVPDLELNLEFELKSVGHLESEELPDMGLISLIQEGGLKLRFAANPYRVYQMALQPLGRALFRSLRHVANDFTFDQTAALPLIQKWIGEGRPMCSMDLSNCSDNLPLDLQLETLARYGVGTRWLQFFRDCCRGKWLVKPFSMMESLSWTVGTPLGLYPTFASFALLHHNLVQWCFDRIGSPKVDGIYPYVIVGDDVVIASREVAEQYQELMTYLGVPISEHKTLWSDSTAEFIGRVITEKSVVQGFKWKGRVSDESFVDFCRQFGPRALSLLTPRQKRVISYIADLPEPYGLGWNPLGIPRDERWTPALETTWARDERARTFMRRSARAYRLLYSSEDKSGRPLIGREADAEYLSSDQEDWELVHAVLPGLEGLGVAIWPNIPSVVPNREMPVETQQLYSDLLRRISYVETRKEASTLVVLERKVRRSLNVWKRSSRVPNP
jgi:hypothetical protein